MMNIALAFAVLDGAKYTSISSLARIIDAQVTHCLYTCILTGMHCVQMVYGEND